MAEPDYVIISNTGIVFYINLCICVVGSHVLFLVCRATTWSAWALTSYIYCENIYMYKLFIQS